MNKLANELVRIADELQNGYNAVHPVLSINLTVEKQNPLDHATFEMKLSFDNGFVPSENFAKEFGKEFLKNSFISSSNIDGDWLTTPIQIMGDYDFDFKCGSKEETEEGTTMAMRNFAWILANWVDNALIECAYMDHVAMDTLKIEAMINGIKVPISV